MRRVEFVQFAIELLYRQGVRKMVLVVLNDERHVANLRSLALEVILEVLNRFEISVQRRFLAVSHEHDAVRSLEHELTRRVVVDLPRHGVELQFRAHPANFSEVEWKEVEEKRAVRFCR